MDISAAFEARYGREPDASEAVIIEAAQEIADLVGECRRALRTDGFMVAGQRQSQRLHPAASMLERAVSNLAARLAQLGLTPRDRIDSDDGQGELFAEQDAHPMTELVRARREIAAVP